MNPAAFQELRWQFGEVTVRQSVTMLGVETKRPSFYVCSTFSVRIDDVGFAHQAHGTRFDFTDADGDKLADVSFREQLARRHLVELAEELHRTADRLVSLSVPKLEVVS